MVSPIGTLVSPEQIPRVHLASDVGQVIAPAVRSHEVAALLERGQIMRHLAAEEVGRIERGLVDQHAHPLGLHALHEPLNRRGAEVVGPALHGQTIHAHSGIGQACDASQRLVGHEVLARAVRVHDGPHYVLGHVRVVRQQLL